MNYLKKGLPLPFLVILESLGRNTSHNEVPDGAVKHLYSLNAP